MGSRRGALVLSVVVALAGASCSNGDDNKEATPAPEANSAENVGAPIGVWSPQSGQPLAEPDQLFSENGLLHVDLDVSTQTIDVSGSPLTARAWNGKLVGPTLHVKPGDTLDVTFMNGTDQNANIHYHGMHVSPLDEGDNVFRTFAPGGTFHSAIQIPTDHETGTYWYHVHFHGVAEGQVMGGLSGLLIVDGLEDRLPPRLRNITQRQLAIRDVRTNGDSILLNPANNSPNDTFTRLVNGQLNPTFSIAPKETQLWRMANIGADAFVEVSMPSHNFVVIAEDGVPVWRVHSEASLTLPTGKRFDVLVTGGALGTYNLQTAGFPSPCPGVPPNGSCAAPKPRDPGTLATVTVTHGRGDGDNGGDVGVEGLEMPTTMMTPEEKAAKDLSNVAPNSAPQTWKFSFGPCPPPGNPSDTCSLINGAMFDPDRMPDAAPTLGDVSDWTLINTTPGPHPFHIHVNSFQVLQMSDPANNNALTPYDAPGLADVVTIPSQIGDVPGQVVIRNRFLDFPGWFVFHCHILSHEDGGMMLTVQVLNPGEQPSPPPHDGTLSGMDHMKNLPHVLE